MADDWLTAAVDGMTLDNGLDTSGGGGESPSLANNISQLLKSTRRDRADLEARLTQLRGFIQQTDEVRPQAAAQLSPRDSVTWLKDGSVCEKVGL